MSSTSQYQTFQDLYQGLQNSVRADTSDSTLDTHAKRYINIALQDMHLGFHYAFPWAERSATIITQPEYTTGTLSVNKGSTSLTGSGTSWNTNNDFSVNNMRVGGKITIDSDVYEITTVSGDTAATIGTKFVNTDVSGSSYKYFEDIYSLASDFLRPLDYTIFSDDEPIHLIGRREFNRRYVKNKITGKPQVATIIDEAPSGNTTLVRKVRFYKPADDSYIIPYSYITSNLVVQSDGTAATELSNDTDEPIVPIRYRHAILFHALYHWYRDKQDDARSQEAKVEYTDIMLRIASDTEIGTSRPSIRPTSVYARRARSPYSHRGRFDVGDRFDNLDW